MTVTPAARVRVPDPGVRRGQAAAAARRADDVQAVSRTRTPTRRCPACVEAATAGGRADEPLPRHGQHRALRGAGGQARRADRAARRWRPASVGADLPAGAGVLRARRRGRLRLAQLRGLPDRGHRRRRAAASRCRCCADGRHDLDAMAAAITDRTKVVHGLHAQQPDRPVGHPGRARRASSRGCPTHVLVVVDEAYVEFVRMGDPVDGVATVPRPRQRRARPAPSPRPTGWPASGSGTPSRPPPIAAALRAVVAAVRGLERRPGRRHRLARAPSRSCSSGSTRWSPSASAWSRACADAGLGRPGGAGQLRLVRRRRPHRRLRRRRRRARHRGPPVRRRGRPGLHRRDRGQRPDHRAAPGRSSADQLQGVTRGRARVRRWPAWRSIPRKLGISAGAMVAAK